jgi:hypothetical protein
MLCVIQLGIFVILAAVGVAVAVARNWEMQFFVTFFV